MCFDLLVLVSLIWLGLILPWRVCFGVCFATLAVL